jgi:folate-binding Fe-S cluster repair protein YgfZ
VARTHFLGQAKRSMRRLRAGRDLQVGEQIEADGKPVGVVACTNIHKPGPEALAALPVEFDATMRCTLSSDNQPAEILAFAEGLAR